MKRLLIPFVALGVLMFGPGSASPKPLEHEHFAGSFSQVHEDFCGIPFVRQDVAFRETITLNPHGPDGLAYSLSRLHVRVLYTNLANGRTAAEVVNNVRKDLKITNNGDGTLTILFLVAGSHKWYDDDGKLFLNDAGQVQFAFQMDHKGTPDDPRDDEFIASFGNAKGPTGRRDSEGRDFCADMRLLLG
jgi:hypothetical protein